MDHAFEVLMNGTKALCGTGSIHERLLDAALVSHHLRLDELLTDANRIRWSAVRDQLSVIEDPQRGAMEASIAAMSDDQAGATAKAFVEVLTYHVMDYEDAASDGRR